MRIEHLPVPHAIAAAGLGQQVRRVGHRLQAPGQHDLRRAGADLIRAEHHGLQARSAHLVERRARHARRHTCPDGRLTCGCLPEACGQHAPQDHLLDISGAEAGGAKRCLDRGTTELRGRQGRERAEKRTDRRAFGGDDDHFVAGHVRSLELNTGASA
jgi:hypothetical protein